MSNVSRPRALEEVLAYRAEHRAVPFGGGTDLMVRYRGYTGTRPRIEGDVLFLDAVEELHAITLEGESLWIGGAATMSEILDDSRVPELLRRSIALIAAPALRNRATLGGNICNASPAADSLPPLYVHEAEVVVKSRSGERTLPIAEFLTGPGRTALAPEEILYGVRLPALPEGRLYYRKVGTRRANALSKLSAAGYARLEAGKVAAFRFAVGAVAPTVVRLPEAEEAVVGKAPGAIDCPRIVDLAAPRIRPIDDQRSTATYRKRVALNALSEFLHQLSEEQ
ncbi:MAG: FAD binding domain-containing protein [Alkalispirochaetaceae bacterium]